MDLLDQIRQEHRMIIDLARELEKIVSGRSVRWGADSQSKLVEVLNRLILMLKSHGELEDQQFYPIIKSHLKGEDSWELGMAETQDEVILTETSRLLELLTDKSAAASLEKINENGLRVVRWIREHVILEEEKLFPKYTGESQDAG